MPNRLADETSPYLLQHAGNPVDWHPWGEQALQKAREEDRPIFLSIGYSACHWCHVMAHESFEDERVAAILNEHFVPVKVDREERPDLDRIYMSAVQAMTGSGGWPMSVFLTPEGHPFYGGTYFPPTPRYGLPSFTQVLSAVADAWRERRPELLQSGQGMLAALERQGLVAVESGGECRLETLTTAFQNLQDRFDHVHGGWGNGPKFPQPMALEFLLRYHRSTGEPQALQMVAETLEAMARGGMYDQLGGGFHRYSVDGRWLVPHFEKMLYDNAQLARVYLHAWQVTGDPFFRTITEETLDYVVREMTDPGGGFYSTQDADSEGEEGKFFLWTTDELLAALGEEAGPFAEAYGVSRSGNFEGKNILSLVGSSEDREALAGARSRLLAVRERRIPPGCDDKILTSWNGLTLAAFAEAARALQRDDYGRVAEENARFLLRELRRPDGRLWHSWRDDRARFNGYLEDYALLIDGLLELYGSTFDPQWFTAARELADEMLAHFQAADWGFYDTSDDHEPLVVRPRELQDNAVPSGNAAAALALQRLAGLATEPAYLEVATAALCALQELMAHYPLGFGQWLIGLDYALARPREIAIVGERDGGDTRALLDACTAGFQPHQVLALGDPRDGPSSVPLLQARGQIDGKATAYVCIDHVCRPPMTDPETLRALFAGTP